MKKDLPENEFVEAALDSVTGMHRAEAPPFLHTRIATKLEHAGSKDGFRSVISRPVFSVVTLVLLVAFNVAALRAYVKKSDVPAKPESIQSFAKEYDLGDAYAYTENNAQ